MAVGEHPPCQILPLLCPEVQRDRLLVAVGSGEIGALARVLAFLVRQVGRHEIARIVAAARPLDLDDLGAEIAKKLRTMRPGEYAREIEHPETLARTLHILLSSSCKDRQSVV